MLQRRFGCSGNVLEVPFGNSGRMAQWNGEYEREQLSSFSDPTGLNRNGLNVHLPAGNWTDPFATESLAVKAGLAKITTMRRPGPNKKVIIVYTDSQGLITALQKGPVRQRDEQLASIWKSIYVLYRNGAKRVVFQWIPSHCGIPRNESADAAARQALNTYSRITQRKVPVRYQNIVSYYKERNKAHYLSELQRKPNTRSVLTTAPANLSNDNSLGRRRQVKLAQLRTGISNTMGNYQSTDTSVQTSTGNADGVKGRMKLCITCTMNVRTFV